MVIQIHHTKTGHAESGFRLQRQDPMSRPPQPLLKRPCRRQQKTKLRVVKTVFLENGVFANNVRTRCIVKGEAQKSPLFWRFSGVFDFLRIACSLGILQTPLLNSLVFTMHLAHWIFVPYRKQVVLTKNCEMTIYILYAPQSPETDESDENGGRRSDKTMVC